MCEGAYTYRVLPNSTDKFRGMIIASMEPTNHHRTWGRKPRLVGEKWEICIRADLITLPWCSKFPVSFCHTPRLAQLPLDGYYYQDQENGEHDPMSYGDLSSSCLPAIILLNWSEEFDNTL
ncbi:hypothetical protein TNCV_1661741 [Trichonephila clavipes]|nr:hypothetical protein TNCV_1661741 [Trichonephila clavipes]